MSFHKSCFEQKPSLFTKTVYQILKHGHSGWVSGDKQYDDYDEAYQEFLRRNTAGGRTADQGMMLAEVILKIKPIVFDKSAFLKSAIEYGFSKKEAKNLPIDWDYFRVGI